MLTIIILVAFTFINKPSKDDIKDFTENYIKEEYDKAEIQYKKDSVYYSNFEEIEITTEATFNKVEYKTPVDIVNKEREKLINEMATPEEITRRLTWVMENRGGTLTIRIYATTYNAANTGNYRIVIVNKDNKEIYREDLKSSKADIWDANSFGKKYWNLATVQLKDKANFPFKVYLINLLDSSKDEFIITTTE